MSQPWQPQEEPQAVDGRGGGVALQRPGRVRARYIQRRDCKPGPWPGSPGLGVGPSDPNGTQPESCVRVYLSVTGSVCACAWRGSEIVWAEGS